MFDQFLASRDALFEHLRVVQRGIDAISGRIDDDFVVEFHVVSVLC